MPRRYHLHWSRENPTININGLIGPDDVSAAALRRSLDDLREEPELRVVIQSDGGETDEGWSIYSLLRNAGKPVDVVIRQAASMAAIVAMAGTRIKIIEGGSLALHHVAFAPAFFTLVANSASRITAQHLMALGRDLGRIDQTHADIICSRTGMSRASFMTLREKEAVLDARQALDLGLVDEIVTGFEEDARAPA